MNKSSIYKSVSDQLDIPQILAKKTIQLFLNEVIQALGEGEKVTLTGFGRFTVKKVPPRIRRNPKSGAKVKVEQNVSIRFKASKRAKENILDVFEHRSNAVGED